jgi:hypothetical protein
VSSEKSIGGAALLVSRVMDLCDLDGASSVSRDWIKLRDVVLSSAMDEAS